MATVDLCTRDFRCPSPIKDEKLEDVDGRAANDDEPFVVVAVAAYGLLSAIKEKVSSLLRQ